MADVIDTTLEPKKLTDLVAEKEVKDTKQPTLTTETVEAILVELKTVQGYGDIAQKVGHDKCTKQQVIEIAQKRQAKIAELQAPPKEVLEPIEVIKQ